MMCGLSWFLFTSLVVHGLLFQLDYCFKFGHRLHEAPTPSLDVSPGGADGAKTSILAMLQAKGKRKRKREEIFRM
jgi:hypothetical protein